MPDLIISFSELAFNPKQFIEDWSNHYDYGMEDYYYKNIDKGLDSYENFILLFQWKNGMPNISKKKQVIVDGFWDNISVLKTLRKNFSWELFETTFNPSKSSAIWKIFLLHIVDKNKFPIFDQHVYRFHKYYDQSIIEEIPYSNKKKYTYYKEEYLNWFNLVKEEDSLNPKKMDEAFFKLGQIIKPLKGLPLNSRTI